MVKDKLDEDKYKKTKYTYRGFNITSSITKPSDESVEDFRTHWHKLFEQKTKEIIQKTNDPD